jgi:putative FmdB family regulatory protein
MPIYEYACKACGHRFERLVRKDTVLNCPACEGQHLERLLSLPSVQSESSRNLSLRAAKRRDAAQGNERMQEQLRYEQSHDRHG